MNSKLREAFEQWAKDEVSHMYYNPRRDVLDDYVQATTQIAWQAFQEAHRLTLNSLCVGADVTPQGAQIALMSKIGDETTVLASGYTKVNSDGFVKVLL